MEQQYQELASRLSSAGRLCFPGSAEFDKANLRFTDYERPVGTRNSVIVRFIRADMKLQKKNNVT